MASTFSKSVLSILLLTALGMTSGCVFTVVADPNAYPVVAPDFAVAAGTKVELVNSFDAKYMARMEGNLQADLQQFTAVAIAQLTRELEKKGAAVGPGGKRVVLEATGPTRNQGMGFLRTSISLNADFGGTRVSAWGQAAGVDVQRDFSSAMSNAVGDLLKQKDFQDFLSKP